MKKGQVLKGFVINRFPMLTLEIDVLRVKNNVVRVFNRETGKVSCTDVLSDDSINIKTGYGWVNFK